MTVAAMMTRENRLETEVLIVRTAVSTMGSISILRAATAVDQRY